jgi:hypothetical protein
MAIVRVDTVRLALAPAPLAYLAEPPEYTLELVAYQVPW